MAEEEEKTRTLKGGGCGTQATLSLFQSFLLPYLISSPNKKSPEKISRDEHART
jgi:hypothetical protein